MKVAGFLFVALIAGASAFVPAPIETKNDVLDTRQARFVDGIIAGVVESICQDMRDAGLDPFVMEQFDISYELPVPVLFSGAASVTNLRVTGASDIVINNINYAILTSRLTLDISLPEIVAHVDNAWFDMTILGHHFSGRTSSRLTLNNLGVSGEIRLNIGIISGIDVRSIALVTRMNRPQYNGFVTLGGHDLTPLVENLAHHYVPATLTEFHNEINLLCEIIVTQVIKDM